MQSTTDVITAGDLEFPPSSIRLADAPPEWRFIHTHFGFGYRFAPEPSQRFHTVALPREQSATTT
jgi:hypothetical protein